jgi:hypothetical protein
MPVIVISGDLVEAELFVVIGPDPFHGVDCATVFHQRAATGLVEYRARRENQALRDRDIRVLPIARQTRHVDRTQAEGSADAQLNAEDFIRTFGASYLQSRGGKFIMMLDVEGTPSLSTDY